MLPTLEMSAGKANIVEVPPTMGAEDFSYFQEKVPGVFFFLGGMDPKKSSSQVAPHHTPDFYLDETGFVLGVKTWSNMVVDYGNRSQQLNTKSAKKGKKSK